MKFFFKACSPFSQRKAATTVSYGLLLALIAVSLLAVLSGTGTNLAALFQQIGNTMGAAGAGNFVSPVTEGPTEGDTCQSLRDGGQTENGIYSIDPDGDGGEAPFDAYCEMGVDGGGWMHAMTVNADDGNLASFTSTLWSGSSFGSEGNRFNDFKSANIASLARDSILIVVREASSAAGSTPLGWRSWNFANTQSVQDMFNETIGAYNANASGGCNGGYSGDGRIQTAGIKSSGQCASYNDPSAGLAEDTFTCHATNLYSNSAYGSCSGTRDYFRLSSWYRWANNSNVGMGLQMDSSSSFYDSDIGTHLAIERWTNPQRYCRDGDTCTNTLTQTTTNTSPGGDHTNHIGNIGQSWRYEIYVK